MYSFLKAFLVLVVHFHSTRFAD